MQLALADSFIDSLNRLDRGDSKRALAFVAKLVRGSTAAGPRSEIVHDAGNRAVRSYKVTHDLRAIGHIEADRLVLLHVARHDHAYVWVRARCIECHPVTGEIISIAEQGSDPAEVAVHPCGDLAELCRVLDANGVAHDLT